MPSRGVERFNLGEEETEREALGETDDRNGELIKVTKLGKVDANEIKRLEESGRLVSVS